MRKARRIRRSAATWHALFARQAKSGLSVAAFCRREALSAQVFRRWQSKLQGDHADVLTRNVSPVGDEAAPFIDLGGIGSGGSGFQVRLDFGAGLVLSIARG